MSPHRRAPADGSARLVPLAAQVGVVILYMIAHAAPPTLWVQGLAMMKPSCLSPSGHDPIAREVVPSCHSVASWSAVERAHPARAGEFRPSLAASAHRGDLPTSVKSGTAVGDWRLLDHF